MHNKAQNMNSFIVERSEAILTNLTKCDVDF